MQTSTWNSDAGGSFASRARGHVPHLSISDENHHVTETIGFLYGDDDERDPRRTSAASSNARSSYYSDKSNEEEITNPQRSSFPRKKVPERRPQETRPDESQIARPSLQTTRSNSFEKMNGNSQLPTANITRDRSPSETAQTQFPLNDIDYESSPAAVAQELSNLQALRRMSMDVHAAGDPDLPALNIAAMPTAPSPTSSEDDAARMFWVPARLHPELAPKEFKTFLESKAEQIKRRSTDAASFTSSPMSSGSIFLNFDEGSLRRKRSMLSREINNSAGYQDGAERLERKRSESHSQQPSDPNLAELELLVGKNLQTQRPATPEEDVDFVLPAGAASGLKRSRKTTYNRRGTDRPQRMRRVQTLDQDGTSTSTSPTPDVPPLPAAYSPTHPAFPAAASDVKTSSSGSQIAASIPPRTSPSLEEPERATREPKPFETKPIAYRPGERRNGQSAVDPQSSRKPVPTTERQHIPRIVETPPRDEPSIRKVPPSSSITEAQSQAPTPPSQPQPQPQPQSNRPRHPERTSSRENLAKAAAVVGRPPMSRTHASASGISMKTSRAEVPPLSTPKQNLEQPSPLPGQDNNTSNLSIIPTLTVDRQSQEKKESKKSSWSWGSLLGKDEEKEKVKVKSGRNSQSHDNTRLDVLQTSIEGNSRRRETIELDRDSLKLDEERKKESHRKGFSGDKKEKKGFMSSLFSREHKTERESKKLTRGLSPEVPYRELKPDVDYSWTRFSILEERAIYRMAHIKLANPRRALYSQVLLSNFMYSYLAKVQQMHPQMNLPTSAKQQRKQKEQRQQQPEEFSTYQRYQQQQEKQHATQTPTHEQQTSTPIYEGEYSSNGFDEHASQSSARGNPYSTGSVGHNSTSYDNGNYSHQNQYHYQQHHRPVEQYEKDREHDTW